MVFAVYSVVQILYMRQLRSIFEHNCMFETHSLRYSISGSKIISVFSPPYNPITHTLQNTLQQCLCKHIRTKYSHKI